MALLPAIGVMAPTLGRLHSARQLVLRTTYWIQPNRRCSSIGDVSVSAMPTSSSAAAAEYKTLSPAQRQQIDAYLDVLLETNKHMNLTGDC